MTFKQKVEKAVREALPKGASCTVLLTKSGVRDTVIVRVITSAWKSLPGYIRVLRIQNRIRNFLSPSDQQKILRVNVFTPDQLREVILHGVRGTSSSTPGKTVSPAFKKLAAKLRAAQLGRGARKKLSNEELLKAALAKIHKS